MRIYSFTRAKRQTTFETLKSTKLTKKQATTIGVLTKIESTYSLP